MSRYVRACLGLGWAALAVNAYAQSSVGTFNSTVTIQGPVNQTATGKNVKQDLNVGSAQKSQANTFSSVVTTGSITQTGNNGAQQFINVGGMNNSKANKFDAQVTTGNIEQVANRGERQELDIGSVTNSTVTGTATTRVSVGSVKQTGEGEIALGAVKNSNVQQFQSNLSVKGKLEGNNIRMGSVVGQERYDNQGRYRGQVATGSVSSLPSVSQITLPGSNNTQASNPVSSSFDSAPVQYPMLDKINSKLQAANSYLFASIAMGSALPTRTADGLFSLPEVMRTGSMYLQFGLTNTIGRAFLNEDGRKKLNEKIRENADGFNDSIKDSWLNSSAWMDDVISYQQKLSTAHAENAGKCFRSPENCKDGLFWGAPKVKGVDDSIVSKSLDGIEIMQAVLNVPKLASDGLSALQKNIVKNKKGVKAETDLIIEKTSPKVLGSGSLSPQKIGMDAEWVDKLRDLSVNGVVLNGKLLKFEFVFRYSNEAIGMVKDGLAVFKPMFIKNKTGKKIDWLLMPDDVRDRYGSYDDFVRQGGDKVVSVYNPVSLDVLNSRLKATGDLPDDLRKTSQKDILSHLSTRSDEYSKLNYQDLIKNGYGIDEYGRLVESSSGRFVVADFDAIQIIDSSGGNFSRAEINSIIDYSKRTKLVGDQTILQHNPSTNNWPTEDGRQKQVLKDLKEGGFVIKGDGVYQVKYDVYGEVSYLPYSAFLPLAHDAESD